jgi:hypothetical protein
MTTTQRQAIKAPSDIEMGMSGIEVAVPASTAARIVAETTLGRVEVGDGFAKKEDAFLTKGAMGEVAPALTIRAGVSLRSLRLRARRGRASHVMPIHLQAHDEGHLRVLGE